MRIPKGQSKMVNPDKLATYGTQDEDKQNKNTAQYMLDTTIHKQTQITWTPWHKTNSCCILKSSIYMMVYQNGFT